ncbi:hypothetical protein BD779DRAFT_1667982 [Infundibulicybe gibba]|nr:hypothetical protein BD779DRAFT_1667982 [Infundibulicybe gibba]
MLPVVTVVGSYCAPHACCRPRAVSRVAVVPPVPVVVLVTVPRVSIMVPAPTIVLAVIHRATVTFPTPKAPPELGMGVGLPQTPPTPADGTQAPSIPKPTAVTVPTYFNDAQRQATEGAGRTACPGVLQATNEFTPAALTSGPDHFDLSVTATYDPGGGTLGTRPPPLPLCRPARE